MERVLKQFLPENTHRENLTATEQADKERQQKVEAQNVSGWLVAVDKLAKGDRTKWDYFFNMGVLEFLNAYSFDKHKNDKYISAVQSATNQGIEAYLLTAIEKLIHG